MFLKIFNLFCNFYLIKKISFDDISKMFLLIKLIK